MPFELRYHPDVKNVDIPQLDAKMKIRIRHAIETRQDILNLYKMTYGQLERRVKELETAR